MKIGILRHGIAWDKVEWAPRDDRKRPLTPEGEKKIRRIAKGLRRLDVSFDRILTSPYTRALQTAESVAKTLKLKEKLEIIPELASDGNPRMLMDRLSRHKKYWDAVLLVGHEPYLTKLITQLTMGPDQPSIQLKKGGFCLLRAEHPRYARCAELEWLVPPKILTRIN